MKPHLFACLSLWTALCACLPLIGCDNPYAPQMDEAAIEKNEEALAALNNECDEDTDCMVTGCHRSICRAAPDGSFCDHTLRFQRLDDDPDTARLQRDLEALLRGLLSDDEHHTLRVVVEPNLVTAWFHTTFTRRDAIEQRFAAITTGGLHRWAPHSQDIALTALAALDQSDARARLALRAAEGGPALLETPIIGGDLAAARRALTDALTGQLDPSTRLAFEVLPRSSPPVLRAWIIDARPLIDMTAISDLRLRSDPAHPDVTLLSGSFAPKAVGPLSASVVGHTLLWVAGDEVVASSLLRAPFRAGAFDLTWSAADGFSQSQTAAAALQRLQQLTSAPALSQRVAFDPDATRAAEAHLACYKRQPPLTSCACVERRCRWRDTSAFDACFDEVRETPR
jgi:hypothetical protein